MSEKNSITQARLKELLSYEPETGLFVWIAKSSPQSRIEIGDVAGTLNSHGYIQIQIDGVLHQAHRLAFLYMMGWMPVEVDHDNRAKDDNRWLNLNPATRTSNGRNHPLRCTNTSGYCGISRHKQTGKWQTHIMVDRESIYLGLFTRKADAIAARQAADLKYKFHTNHGK